MMAIITIITIIKVIGDNSFFNFHHLLSVSCAPNVTPKLQFIPIIASLANLVPLDILDMPVQEKDIETVLMAGVSEVPVGVHSGRVLVPESEIPPGICSSCWLIPINGVYKPAPFRGAILGAITPPTPNTIAKVIFCSTPTI